MFDSVINSASVVGEYHHLGVSLRQWLQLLVAALGLWALFRFLLHRMRNRLQRLAEQSSAAWDDILVRLLGRTHGLFLFTLCLYMAARVMGLAPAALDILQKVLTVGLFFQLAIWGNEGLQQWLSRYLTNRHGQSEQVDLSTYSAINITAKFLLYLILLLLLLDNLGVNITALVTGLGIGGIAIALAVQNILGDIFASLTIVLDRPFEVGDFIVVDGRMGTVEMVGLKTTNVRALSGEQLIFPNKKLIESYIQNFKRMQERRVAFQLGVAYETDPALLREIPILIKDIILSQRQTRFDHVHLLEYGQSSLNYEVVFYMTTSENAVAQDVRQEVNIRILEIFRSKGISMSSPSVSIVRQDNSGPGFVQGQQSIDAEKSAKE